MSYRCINPSCYQGDPGDPPEFESDNSVPCRTCGEEIDLDDDEYTIHGDVSYDCSECYPIIVDNDEEDEEEA
jgi:hypothetical protein